MTNTHEEDVSWQTGDHVHHHTFGLQVCGQFVTRLQKSITKLIQTVLKVKDRGCTSTVRKRQLKCD